MEVFLIKEGKEHGQAVAYLDDGIMIVVEEGYRHIDEHNSSCNKCVADFGRPYDICKTKNDRTDK